MKKLLASAAVVLMLGTASPAFAEGDEDRPPCGTPGQPACGPTSPPEQPSPGPEPALCDDGEPCKTGCARHVPPTERVVFVEVPASPSMVELSMVELIAQYETANLRAGKAEHQMLKLQAKVKRLRAKVKRLRSR